MNYFILGFAISCLVFLAVIATACLSISRLINRRITKLEKKFKRFKSHLPQNKSNNLDENQNIGNNTVSDDATPPKQPDFWDDIEKMTKLRDDVAAGNFERQAEFTEISNLLPLDAVRFIDERLLEAQAQQSSGAAR